MRIHHVSHLHQRGVTFVEVMVSIAVFVFTILAIISSVQYFYRTNTYAIEQASAVSSAQRGVESTVKTIREAAYSSNGAYPVEAIATSSFTFYADIDSDSLIEKVRYFVQGTSLFRDVTDPTGDPPTYGSPQTNSIISETIRNIEQNVNTFRYYDKNGAQITDYTKVADVRFVTIELIVNVDPYRLPNQLTLRSNAALRNIK